MGGDGDQLVDNLSCFSQSELGPAVLKASAHLNQLKIGSLFVHLPASILVSHTSYLLSQVPTTRLISGKNLQMNRGDLNRTSIRKDGARRPSLL